MRGGARRGSRESRNKRLGDGDRGGKKRREPLKGNKCSGENKNFLSEYIIIQLCWNFSRFDWLF